MALFDQTKFDAFLQRVHKSNNRKILDFIQQVGPQYTLECTNCKKPCFLYEYTQREQYKHGFYRNKCTKCINQSHDPFAVMIYNMKKHTKNRNSKGRNHADVFYDAQKLKDLFKEQKGLCYYSGEKMIQKSRITHDPYQMSIERLDEQLGYVENNCVLVCLKNQLSTKGASFEVKKEIVELSINPIKNTLESNLPFTRCPKTVWTKKDFEKEKTCFPRYKKRTTMEKNGIKLQQCNKCEDFKVFTEFHKHRGTIATMCKTCNNQSKLEKLNTPRGYVMAMCRGAGDRAKSRSRNEKRNDDSGDVDHNLFDIVVDKIIEQKGCCVVTKIPFDFKTNSPCQPSIDRLDNSKGYIKDNIRIVISPVNNPGR